MNRITVGKAGRDIIGEGREAGEMAMTKKGKIGKVCLNLGWVSPVWR